jgi:antirestriction protein ArdC
MDDNGNGKGQLPFEIISDRIGALLEQGTIPWRKPWNATTDFPRNIEGRRYSGINVFMLMAQGHGSPFWMTFKQARERGGSVTKGSKGTPVVFWSFVKKPVEQEDGTFKVREIPFLKWFTVFNLSQTENVKPTKAMLASEAAQGTVAPDPIEAAEAIVAGMPTPPTIDFNGGNRAFYRPATDSISMPAKASFTSADEMYSTLFHEIAHSTGHKSRLARKTMTSEWTGFGSEEYSREELVAEFTAAFLAGEAGTLPATIENSTAYIQNWLKAIKVGPASAGRRGWRGPEGSELHPRPGAGQGRDDGGGGGMTATDLREEREAEARIDWASEQYEAELDAVAARYGIDREDEQSLREALEDDADWWSDRR